MNYAIAIALIGIFGIWGWRCKIAYNRRILRIKDCADMERDVIKGLSVSQWLDLLNRGNLQTLVAKSVGVLNILGHTVLLVDGYITHTTLGRFGAIGGRSPMLFLVATDSEANSTFKARPREFKWLNGTDKYAAFGIRRLDNVITLCKPIDTK